MHLVTPEGTRFYYFLDTEEPSTKESLPIQGERPDPRILRLALAGADTRLALFPSMLQPKRGWFYYLYWSDGQDLAEVDRRVLAGEYSDSDFTASVKTVYQETVCDWCHRAWATLVIPPGDPYPGVPGLIDRKISASRFLRCPACGTRFRQMVVKILGDGQAASGSHSPARM